MKVVELLDQRRAQWRELEQLCRDLESLRRQRLGGSTIARFAALYRAACADLALADAYQLPPTTVEYLHQLVGRAHNQLYRSRRFRFQDWAHEMFVVVPQRLFHDSFLRLAFVLFWGVFVGSMLLARWSPGFAQELASQEMLDLMQENFANPISDRGPDEAAAMSGFYIYHNTSIGLRCFAGGLLFGVGGLFTTVYNAAFLGTIFGFMSTVPEQQNFFHFVTAHGPFELTAIVLSAAAGMRLGFALIDTRGRSRRESLRDAGREAMPTMGAAIALFFMAALIEAFLSPSAAPYVVKVFVAVFSSALLMVYFVILGLPRGGSHAT